MNQKRPAQRPEKREYKQERKAYPPLPPLPCHAKKAAALLKQWVKDSIVQLSPVSSAPTPAEETDPNFCLCHRRKGHTLEQCFVFRKIFDKKLEDREIILQGEGAHNVYQRPFPKHNNKGKGHEMMVSAPGSSTRTDGSDDCDQMQVESNACTNSSISMIRWISVQSKDWLSLNPLSSSQIHPRVVIWSKGG